MKVNIRKILAVTIALTPVAVGAEEMPWQDYAKRIQSQTMIGPLKTDLFGDQVNFYNGTLSFSVTDISISGNSKLPVELRRIFAVAKAGDYVDRVGHDMPLADWDLDLPRISGVFSSWPAQRCSGGRRPPEVRFDTSHPPFTTIYFADDYWHGTHAFLPSGGGELLEPNPNAPSPGPAYIWVTAERTFFSCLTSIKNAAGEGFLGVTPDGTKYWFDWMGAYQEETLLSPRNWNSSLSGDPEKLGRSRQVLYATRVEDRFGNWVTYSFINGSNEPARLASINASDGRSISLTYNSIGQIDTASADGRTWRYTYSYPDYGPPYGIDYTYGSLSDVHLPDGSRWWIDLTGFNTIEPGSNQGCDEPAVVNPPTTGPQPYDHMVGTITHPSGAVGAFTLRGVALGRTNVPRVCNENAVGVPGDDVVEYVRVYKLPSIARKVVSGPGIQTAEWNYSYQTSASWAQTPYEYDTYGIKPKCTSDACAGTTSVTIREPDNDWTRYEFGNSYRYDEGKLRKVVRGNSGGTLRTEQFSY